MLLQSLPSELICCISHTVSNWSIERSAFYLFTHKFLIWTKYKCKSMKIGPSNIWRLAYNFAINIIILSTKNRSRKVYTQTWQEKDGKNSEEYIISLGMQKTEQVSCSLLPSLLFIEIPTYFLSKTWSEISIALNGMGFLKERMLGCDFL